METSDFVKIQPHSGGESLSMWPHLLLPGSSTLFSTALDRPMTALRLFDGSNPADKLCGTSSCISSPPTKSAPGRCDYHTCHLVFAHSRLPLLPPLPSSSYGTSTSKSSDHGGQRPRTQRSTMVLREPGIHYHPDRSVERAIRYVISHPPLCQSARYLPHARYSHLVGGRCAFLPHVSAYMRRADTTLVPRADICVLYMQPSAVNGHANIAPQHSASVHINYLVHGRRDLARLQHRHVRIWSYPGIVLRVVRARRLQRVRAGRWEAVMDAHSRAWDQRKSGPPNSCTS